jgi:hypothetical protein
MQAPRGIYLPSKLKKVLERRFQRRGRALKTRRATLSPVARAARARLLRAAARAYTALATTSVGPPVNHADPPYLAPTPATDPVGGALAVRVFLVE